MRIKKITSQHRRDFYAIYVCEHCNKESKGSGYDDRYFHAEVIPAMKCKSCGLAAGDSYKPLATKYPDNAVI